MIFEYCALNKHFRIPVLTVVSSIAFRGVFCLDILRSAAMPYNGLESHGTHCLDQRHVLPKGFHCLPRRAIILYARWMIQRRKLIPTFSDFL